MGNDSRQGRKQQRRSGWKWTVIAGITALVVVLVFILGMALGRGRHNRLDVASSSTAVTSSSQSTSSSTSSVATSSSAVASSEESDDPFKYSVGAGDFNGVTFRGYGVNEPGSISINSVQGESYNYILTITGPATSDDSSDVTRVAAEVRQGPVTQFRVFGRPNIRTVKANTQVNIVDTIDTDDSSNDDGSQYVGERFYLFYNASGTLSLATPNFAGNVTEDETDVKAEYIQE